MGVQLLVAVLDDDPLPPGGQFIQHLADGLVLDDVDESHVPRGIHDDGVGIRVPLEQQIAAFHFLAVGHPQQGAERHGEARAHLALGIEQ
jgi:hypothetical protein